MKRGNIINLVIVVVFIVSAGIYINYDLRKTKRIYQAVDKEFPAILFEEYLEGTVTNIYRPYPEKFRISPLRVHVLINGSIKKTVNSGYEFTRNSTLDSVLNVGDYLFKRGGSDTLVVYKIEETDTIMFGFQLKNSFGYSLNKK
jgi:hypothetical protein